MGSVIENDPLTRVKYVITGFSKFDGANINPTQELVQELQEYCIRDGNNSSSFFRCLVLKVSADSCDAFLAEMAEIVSHELCDHTVYWVHLGVDPRGKMIELESRAMNNASFMGPDEDGCQLLYQQIDKECPYDEPLLTTLNIDSIMNRLEKYDVNVRKSFDAGRFVCNWIYYRSLRQAQVLGKNNWHALFVHVPHFSEVSKERQLRTISALLKALKEEALEVKASKQQNTTAVTRTTMNLSHS